MKNGRSDKSKKKRGLPTEADRAPMADHAPEETGRASRTLGKGRRWTMVDTVIVLMVVLAVAGAVIRGVMDRREEAALPAEGPFYVSFSVEEIHPAVLSEIEAFDPLYLYDEGVLMGYVGVYDDGSLALHSVSQPLLSHNGMVAAEGTMVCLEGVYQNGSLLVTGSDIYLTPGARLVLRTDRAMLTVEITEIRANG